MAREVILAVLRATQSLVCLRTSVQGEGTIKRTCPKDFSLDGSQCVSGVIIKDCPQGYHFERELVFGQTSVFCVGPAIEEVQCPSGFHKISENPRYCVGPRKF